MLYKAIEITSSEEPILGILPANCRTAFNIFLMQETTKENNLLENVLHRFDSVKKKKSVFHP